MRGLFGSLAAPVRRDSGAAPGVSGQGGPSGSWIPAFGGNMSATGLRVNQATAMAVSTVYACVTVRSEDVARCTPGLFHVDAKTGARVRVTDHPVARLFLRPNPIQTWFEFCEQMQAARLLRGNAYAVLIPDSRGDIIAMVPVNPDQVVMMEAPDGSLFYSVSRLGLWQIAMLRDLPAAIPAEFMLHLRGLSLSALLGTSTIALARDAIGLAQAQEQQAARWLKNGARPSGVLKLAKALTETTAARLKGQWEAFRAGIDNTGSTAVLEEGMDYQTLQLTSVDLEFLASRNLQMEEISRYFRVPPRKLGRLEPSGKGGNTTQQDQEYVNEAIMPDLTRWEEKITRVFDLSKDGLVVDFDEGQLLRADAQTRYNIYRVGILTGITTQNECRLAEGLPPMDGGDDLLRPVNMAPQGSELNNEAPDGAGRPPSGTLPTPTGEAPAPVDDDPGPTTGG